MRVYVHTAVKTLFVCHRYHCVLSALTQQSSELQDTRMLTEFLERLELEDSQELNAEHYHFDQVIIRIVFRLSAVMLFLVNRLSFNKLCLAASSQRHFLSPYIACTPKKWCQGPVD